MQILIPNTIFEQEINRRKNNISEFNEKVNKIGEKKNRLEQMKEEQIKLAFEIENDEKEVSDFSVEKTENEIAELKKYAVQVGVFGEETNETQIEVNENE